MHAFYSQVQEFCVMMYEELAKRWDGLPETPVSPATAQEFMEKFVLCPTDESARSCIQSDFPGALSFAMAIEGVNQRILNGGLRLQEEWPAHQTRFYVLSCAVQDYIDSLPARPQPAKAA